MPVFSQHADNSAIAVRRLSRGQGARIRVCHMVVRGALDGAQRSMLDICRRLDPARYERHVVCQAEGPLTDELRRLGIAYHLVPQLGRSIHPLRDFAAARAMRRICRRHAFDIVHTHTSKAGLLGRLAARTAGVPCIFHHVRGYAFHEFSKPWSHWALSRIESLAGRWCDRVIFVNHEERRMSIERRWLPAEKCLTIYNGAELDQFDPGRPHEQRATTRRQLGIADGEVAILFSGRLMAQKQPLALPEIAAAIEARRPRTPWRIVVAGEGPLEAPLQAAAERRGVAHRIRRLGWQSDTVATFRAADLVLLPSLWEGLPRVLIEAQAAGLPIVASDVKGNREVVTAATGFLCAPRDPFSYAAPLARLIDNEPLRRWLGTAARRRAEQDFDVAANVARIVELYEHLLQGRSLARRAA